MASPAHDFTRLQKMAIFLVALGTEKAREILADVDLETVEKINTAIVGLGSVPPEVKAAVMIEFGDFFFKDKPLSGKFAELGEKKAGPAKKTRAPSSPGKATKSKKTQPSAAKTATVKKKKPPASTTPPAPTAKDEETNILKTLQKLRERVDPGKIDWSRAGYDFGEGFKGPGKERR